MGRLYVSPFYNLSFIRENDAKETNTQLPLGPVAAETIVDAGTQSDHGNFVSKASWDQEHGVFTITHQSNEGESKHLLDIVMTAKDGKLTLNITGPKREKMPSFEIAVSGDALKDRMILYKLHEYILDSTRKAEKTLDIQTSSRIAH